MTDLKQLLKQRSREKSEVKKNTLVSYEGNGEVFICSYKKEIKFFTMYFVECQGRNLQDYDRNLQNEECVEILTSTRIL